MSKSLYVLAGYDNITEEHLQNIQNKVYESGFTGTQTKNIPQHITLGSFNTEKEADLISLLNDLSHTGKSFDITFNHIGMFSGGNVLFIAPDTNNNLLDLKENFGSSYNWAPHSTILIDNTEKILNALPIVLDNFSPFCGKVTSLHLYEFFPVRHILTVELK